MFICKITVSEHPGVWIVYLSLSEINMQPILYESLLPSVLLYKQEENIFGKLQLQKTQKPFLAVATKGSFNVWQFMQGIFSDAITACHYKHETKNQQLIMSLLWASNVPFMLSLTMSPTLFTNSASIKLISYCRMTKAFPPLIIELNTPQVHCRPVLCIAESSLRSNIKAMWMWKTYWWGAPPQDSNKRCLWFRTVQRHRGHW